MEEEKLIDVLFLMTYVAPMKIVLNKINYKH